MVTVGMDSLGAISASMTDINLCLCLQKQLAWISRKVILKHPCICIAQYHYCSTINNSNLIMHTSFFFAKMNISCSLSITP